MQLPIFLTIELVVLIAALVLSMRQRWVSSRRTVVARSVVIWTLAATSIILAGNQLVGSVPLGVAIAGPIIVGILAGTASAAK